MKWTIHGLLQIELLKYPDIDLIDAAILNYLSDFISSGKMTAFDYNGERFYWLHYDTLLSNLPILKIKKDTLYRRLKKLENYNLIKAHTVKLGGTYSYYKLTDDFIRLKYSNIGEYARPDYNPTPTDLNPYPSEINPTPPDLNPDPSGSKSVPGTDENPEQRFTIKQLSIKDSNTTEEKKLTEEETKAVIKKMFDDDLIRHSSDEVF